MFFFNEYRDFAFLENLSVMFIGGTNMFKFSNVHILIQLKTLHVELCSAFFTNSSLIKYIKRYSELIK